MECDICGYKSSSPEEDRLLEIYGCSRARIDNSGISHNIELCAHDYTSGKYYAPGTNPEVQQEDPNALKEQFVKRYEDEKSRKEKKKDGGKK